ncbi:phosphatidylinositol-specific phospholipase C-like protein 5 [Elsinoe australis]|uniref:Phosphatidylinositol-specific phospholipase C-like protein 5 n=1 Tax=Elsinoe australis TaxID=40998 RepID=A0A4U7API3_9PEZI|nr:phosphatidylinositol-specific phospholipase C-like protein 5 [Elsinoe australis]
MSVNHKLAHLALETICHDAEPIFGSKSTEGSTEWSTWMAKYPDDTKLAHMNIPGAHDAATWNYTTETQQSLAHVTSLAKQQVPPPDWLRCQGQSISQMLNAGVRAFDLRYEQDATKQTLVFWHGPALLSQTATVNDVMFGFYQWLSDHPSEVVFLSFQREGSVDNAADVQMHIYDMLTSPAAKEYILSTSDTLEILGQARGKIVLLRRFDLDLLPPSYETNVPGLRFSPEDWTDNGASITIAYNSEHDPGTGKGLAYIEDYYGPETSPSSSLQENVEVNMKAVLSHLDKAADGHLPDGLFWGFASGKNVRHDVAITPRLMALGDGTVRGVNDRLMEYFKDKRGKRFGIVMFDFCEEPHELIPTFLSLQAP